MRKLLAAAVFASSLLWATAAFAALSLFGSATSLTSSVTLPASINAGDVIVFANAAVNTAATIPTDAVPAGFTEINTVSANGTGGSADQRATLSYKIAAGTEGGTSISALSGTNSVRCQALVFRAASAITGVTAASANQQGTDATPTNQTITSGSGAAPLIDLAYYRSNNTLSTHAMSPTADGNVGANANNSVEYKLYDASPADVTVSMADAGTGNILMSAYLALTLTGGASPHYPINFPMLGM